MAKLTEKQIRELARTIVLASPGGIQFTPLWKQIHQKNPATPEKDIQWKMWNLEEIFADEVTKPAAASLCQPQKLAPNRPLARSQSKPHRRA